LLVGGVQQSYTSSASLAQLQAQQEQEMERHNRDKTEYHTTITKSLSPQKGFKTMTHGTAAILAGNSGSYATQKSTVV